MRSIKRIFIFSSGGDCPGLNQVLFHLYKMFVQRKIEVYVIYNGLAGIIDPKNVKKLTYDEVHSHFGKSGTFLGSVRDTVTSKKDGELFVDHPLIVQIDSAFHRYKFDAGLFTGGNGSMASMYHVSKYTGMPMIGIPKTIDGDVPFTNFSLGFSSASEYLIQEINRLRSTSHSHGTIHCIQAMGRDAGHLALHAGFSAAATAVLIPEISFDYQELKDCLLARISMSESGRACPILVVSEGVQKLPEDVDNPKYANMGAARYVSVKLTELGLSHVKYSVPGHSQRGAEPTYYDYKRAAIFAVEAVKRLLSGETNVMLSYEGDHVSSVPFEDIMQADTKMVSKRSTLLKYAIDSGIYIGDVS